MVGIVFDGFNNESLAADDYYAESETMHLLDVFFINLRVVSQRDSDVNNNIQASASSDWCT